MAASQDISQFVTPEAEAGLGRSIGLMEKGVTVAAELTKNLKAASDALGSAKTLTDLAKAQTEAAKAQTELAKANLQLAKSESEVIRQLELEEKVRSAEARTATTLAQKRTAEAKTLAINAREQSRVNKEQATANAQSEKAAAISARQAAATDKLNNAYEQLKIKYRDAANEAKKLNAELGLTDPAAIAASKSAKALSDQLVAIEAAVGQNQRNVGNYKSGYDGIGMQLQGLFREVPSVQNLNQLFLSWSNQLPLLSDEIQRATAELKGFKAATEEANAAQALAQTAQTAAQQAADATAESLGDQIDSVVGTISASREQAIALKEQIGEQIAASGASLEAAAAAGVNTEALLVNAGASVEDAAAIGAQVRANGANVVAAANATAALEAQTVATTQATAAQTAQLSVGARLLKSIFSLNTALTVGILLLTAFGADAASAIADSLSSASDEADNLAESIKTANDAIADTRSTVARTTAEVETMRIRFSEARIGIISKEDALKLYNDTLGETWGKSNDLNEAEATFIKNAEKYIEYTYKKALAQVAFTKAAEKTLEAELEAQKGSEEILTGYESFAAGIEKAVSSYSETERGALAARDKNIETLRRQAKDLMNIGQNSQIESDTLASELNIQITKKEKEERVKAAQDTTNEVINIEERLNKARADLQSQRLQGNKEDLQAIFENEQEGLAMRLSAREEFYQKELQQQKVAAKAELDNIDVNLKKIAQLEGKGGKLSNEQKNLVRQKEAFEAERLVITDKYAALQAKSERENNKFSQDAVTKDLEKQIATRRALLDNNIAYLKANLSEQETEERRALNKRFASGAISEARYRADLEAMNKAYDMRELEGARDLTMAKMQELQNLGADTEAEEKKLADIIVAINNEKNAKIEAADVQAGQRRAKLLRALGDLAQEILNGIGTIISAQADKELARLQKQGDQIDKNKDKEIEAINATTASQEEKQRKIAEAEARAQAQRDQLAEKERAVRKRQAQFERGITIAQIIAKTAEAVLTQLSVPGAGIGLAAVAAAIGAVQLATVLATPLPEYALGAGIPGRPKHKGGLARVGEAGAELIIEPGRKPYMVDSDQVRDLPRNTIVAPQDRINALGYGMLNAVVSQRQQGMMRQDNSDITERLDKWGSRQERAIRSTAPKGSTGVEKWYEWQKYNRR